MLYDQRLELLESSQVNHRTWVQSRHSIYLICTLLDGITGRHSICPDSFQHCWTGLGITILWSSAVPSLNPKFSLPSADPVLVLQVTKNIVLQWGELPTSVAYIGTGQIMGWGNKAIEIRSVETGHLDGVFMHKKAQKLKFLCERNDKASTVLQCNNLSIVFIRSGIVLVISNFRYSSQVLRAVLRVKFTSWLLTSLGWRIGSHHEVWWT